MRVLLALLTVLGAFFHPSIAEACSCFDSVSSMTAFKHADLVFIGTVVQRDSGFRSTNRTNADGSFTVSGGVSSIGGVTFDVTRVYRGNAVPRIVVQGDNGTCGLPFRDGESWLVYASTRDGRVTTSKCTRTRLNSEADHDRAYLDGLEQRRRVGVIYGNVLRLVTGAAGDPSLGVLSEPLQVIAMGDGRQVEITTDRSGSFQFVLPPGDFDVWVERGGRVVSQRERVSVEYDAERRLLLRAEFDN